MRVYKLHDYFFACAPIFFYGIAFIAFCHDEKYGHLDMDMDMDVCGMVAKHQN